MASTFRDKYSLPLVMLRNGSFLFRFPPYLHGEAWWTPCDLVADDLAPPCAALPVGGPSGSRPAATRWRPSDPLPQLRSCLRLLLPHDDDEAC